MALPYIDAAEKHLQAAQDKQWDYPAGSIFETKEEVLRALKDGKTIDEVYMQCIAKFGTVTGGLLNSLLGHTSNNTRAAVRKGMKQLFTNIQNLK